MLSVGTAGSSWGCLAIESVVCCLFPLRSTSEGWWEWLSVYGWRLTSDGGMARLRAKPSINRPPEHAGCPTHSPAAVGRIDMIASCSRCESPGNRDSSDQATFLHDGDGILQILVVTSGYLSYCCLSIISNQSVHSPLTSDINKAFPSTQLPLTGYFLFFRPFSVNTRDGCVWKSQ